MRILAVDISGVFSQMWEGWTMVTERGPCDGKGNLLDPRTDTERYAELRALVEAWQSHQAGSSTALAEWRHR